MGFNSRFKGLNFLKPKFRYFRFVLMYIWCWN